jgi:hypothetical protein
MNILQLNIQFRVLKRVTAMVLLLAGFASTAAAETSDKWETHLDVYLWGASIGGRTADGSDLDVSFDDLLKNLQMGFMGTVGVRKGKLAMLADLIYLDVSESKSNSGEFLGQPIEEKGKLELTGWVSTFGAGYSLINDGRNSLDILLAARYLNLDSTFTFKVDDESRKFDLGGVFWDGVVALNGKTQLGEKWYLAYYADLGAGDSDFTWQTRLGFGYNLKKHALFFGYRYLDWDFKSGDRLNVSLPGLGFQVRRSLERSEFPRSIRRREVFVLIPALAAKTIHFVKYGDSHAYLTHSFLPDPDHGSQCVGILTVRK